MPDLHPQESRTGTSQPERRKYPRTPTAVPVEFRPEGAAVATRTETTDLSLTGCYLQMNFTLQVGTKLDMVLWLDGEKATTQALVATHHPGFGNGIQFVDMPEEDRSKLKRFLDSVAQKEKPEATPPAESEFPIEHF